MTMKIDKGTLKLPKPLQFLIFKACVKDNYKILNFDVFSVINVKNIPNYHEILMVIFLRFAITEPNLQLCDRNSYI